LKLFFGRDWQTFLSKMKLRNIKDVISVLITYICFICVKNSSSISILISYNKIRIKRLWNSPTLDFNDKLIITKCFNDIYWRWIQFFWMDYVKTFYIFFIQSDLAKLKSIIKDVINLMFHYIQYFNNIDTSLNFLFFDIHL
jgi:hypothetical protein